MNAWTETFRSLRSPSYRRWATGALVSNVGTWMQRVAQDWLVLTQLTRGSASALGVVMALQFAPQLLLLPLTGVAADRLDRRKLLLATQATMGALALGLGVLTVAGAVRLWHVEVFAFLLGCATAFDAPARHAFVGELVDAPDVPNAVALNSTSFSAARMIGPALAGALIAVVGTGWIFVVNALSFVAVLASLASLRPEALRAGGRGRAHGGLAEGFAYAWKRPDLKTIFVMLFLVGTFGLNFPIFVSTMAVRVFHEGAGKYGLLTSAMAIGTIGGALLSARQERPRAAFIAGGAALFGVGAAVAASMPSYLLFGAALVVVGAAAQTFITSASGFVQLATSPELRGRVMAIFLAIALGGTPVGAPIVGWVADAYGPRWALAVGAAAGALAALVGALALMPLAQPFAPVHEGE